MPTPTHYTRLPAGYAPPEKVNLPLPFMRHFELSVDVARSGLPATTAREALEDLPAISEHLADASQVSRQPSARTCAYRGAPSSRFAQLMRQWPGLRGSGRVRDHVIRRTPRDYETFRRMNAGCRYPEAVAIARSRFQEELDRLAGEGLTPVPGSPEYQELERRFVPPYPVESFLDKWRKLDPGQPSHTVPAHLSKDAYSHIHYDSTQARAISIREAARLQSFPDGFRFAGNMGECYRQIGNAVPPLLAWAIAAELLSGLGFPSMPVPWITD